MTGTSREPGRDPMTSWVESSFEVLKTQARVGGLMTQVMVEQTRKQQEAVQGLADESVRLYSDLFYAPLRSLAGAPAPRNGNGGGHADDLPIKDYDSLSVEEVGGRLGDCGIRDVEKLKNYERRHRNRRNYMELLDRSLV